ncbi:MAG: serine/threonine protein kinase [Prevotella sp.]|nr:serine/threonine protein kinase [Prevotella sp.]
MNASLNNGATLQNGKYVIVKTLGQGGFGITYQAVQSDNQRQVAIKELFMQGINERSSADSTTVVVSNQANSVPFSQQRSKFEKEARRLSELDEPHIVKVYDFFEENETAYYVMDYVQGRSLADVSKAQVVTEQQAYDYLEQMLATLRTLHQHHIWHLDIKPANILINDQNQLILIDFGASKHIEHGGMMTTSSALAYTPGFAPPEQMQGNMDKFGPWTDFYALGATIYQILTRQTPPSIADILGEGVGAFAFPQTVSYDMQQRIMWMMRPNYKERPQQVDDFYYQPDPQTQVVNNNPYNDVPVQPTRSKGNSMLLGFIVTALAALLILLVVFIVKQQSSDDSSFSQEVAAVDTTVTETASEEPAEEAAPEIRRWDGSYTAEHCAGDTYGGTAICFTTNITLSSKNGNDEYSGNMTIDGYQTGWSGGITATAFDDNSIKIWVKSPQDQMFTDGDAICRIKYNDNGSLSVDWFASMIEAQFVDQNTKIKKN